MAQEEGLVKVSREEIHADKEEGLTGATTGAEKVEETSPTTDTSVTKVENATAEELGADEEGGKASIKDKVKGKILQIGEKLSSKTNAEAKAADPHKGVM